MKSISKSFMRGLMILFDFFLLSLISWQKQSHISFALSHECSSSVKTINHSHPKAQIIRIFLNFKSPSLPRGGGHSKALEVYKEGFYD